MGTLDPGQNFTHLLDVVSGYDGMHDLQYAATPALLGTSTTPKEEVFERGSLISLNSAGEWVPGCANGAMPCWAINATGDFDVNSDIGNVSGGVVAAYVATGGFELKTTEFDLTDTYNPNTALSAGTGSIDDAASDAKGKVVAASDVLAATSIVGVVSKGESMEVYGQPSLQFWPVYLPARA